MGKQPKHLFEVTGDNLDVGYVNLRDGDSETIVGIRDSVRQLWEQYEPYADRHFVQNFARQIEERFWEMYLACALMDMGFEIKSQDAGPDIEVSHGDKRVWVEAIAATPGAEDSPDKVPPLVPLSESGTASEVPVDQVKLRYTAALKEKKDKFAADAEKKTIDPGDICIVAISGARLVPHSYAGGGVPYIVRSVFPIGDQYVTFSKETLEVVDTGYHIQPTVTKHGGAEVDLTAFLDDAYSGVSGLIFMPTGVGNMPDRFGASFVTVHNPVATNPFELGLIQRGEEYWAVESDGGYDLKYKNWEAESQDN